MCTKLDRIAEFARNNPKDKFTSLMHLVNKEMLTMCHYELSGNKATGVDKVTKKDYEANLEGNIDDLIIRMKAFKYRPQPVKRVYIDKPGSDSNLTRSELGSTPRENKSFQVQTLYYN